MVSALTTYLYAIISFLSDLRVYLTSPNPHNYFSAQFGPSQVDQFLAAIQMRFYLHCLHSMLFQDNESVVQAQATLLAEHVTTLHIVTVSSAALSLGFDILELAIRDLRVSM